ncbi:unnamed protein product [Phytophthora fragariaefolia]|uniref:Unnamed protein product n=1 Tax=Phytophthora fragariaefolia TaxID=1490495 RepID=A0A9W6UDZ3_9STRA|nr:unnamed protein product [Phytophthora fragariaefolia]
MNKPGSTHGTRRGGPHVIGEAGALSLAHEERTVTGLAHVKDSGVAGVTEAIEEKAAPKKRSVSRVDGDNDVEAEEAGEAWGQSDPNSGEGSGADEMSGDGDETEE